MTCLYTGHVLSPSVAGPCQATAAAHSDVSQSSTECLLLSGACQHTSTTLITHMSTTYAPSRSRVCYASATRHNALHSGLCWNVLISWLWSMVCSARDVHVINRQDTSFNRLRPETGWWSRSCNKLWSTQPRSLSPTTTLSNSNQSECDRSSNSFQLKLV